MYRLAKYSRSEMRSNLREMYTQLARFIDALKLNLNTLDGVFKMGGTDPRLRTSFITLVEANDLMAKADRRGGGEWMD